MPDGTLPAMTPGGAQAAPDATARYDRPSLIGFIADARSEEALRDGLGDVTTEALDIRRGGVRAAVAAMQKQATPKVLVVDVSGESQPLTALGDLAHVVEPDVCVLVVGETNHVDFYREVTRGMGAADYLAKPLTRDTVARHFATYLRGRTPAGPAALGGRAIAVTGVRGGVGATTLAVNLAWNFGVTMRRHTVLLDPDIHLGSAAFLLNVQPGAGLRMALETPDRIDSLLAERAAQPAADRLHVLAGEEKLAIQPNPAAGAGQVLLDALRRRYNFIVADVPFAPVPLYRDLLDLVDQRVLVMEPTLAAVRDTLRLLALPDGPDQSQRAIVVLNRVGIPGGLTRRQVEDALKMKVDVAIPDLPRQVGNAATLGEPVISTSNGFRSGILELARQVAFVGLLDSTPDAINSMQAGQQKSRWNFLRRRS
ncbi:MAG TPA: cellulose synthase operon protein YhjQ/BcsQ [Acetobacteraceae bacterium]|jgi:pilus assembly protein CpaE